MTWLLRLVNQSTHFFLSTLFDHYHILDVIIVPIRKVFKFNELNQSEV